MGDVSVEVWLNKHRYDALEKAMNERGTSIEKHMQDYFINLYCEMVPPERRQKTEQLIEEERIRDELRTQEMRKFAVFHIIEKGEEHFFEFNSPMEFMQTARQLRRYLRGELAQNPENFTAWFQGAIPINNQKFLECVNEYLKNNEKITGVFYIDFDKQEISALHLLGSWKTYSMKDASTAAYHAYRADDTSLDQRWSRFLEYLDGKELTQEQSFQIPKIW